MSKIKTILLTEDRLHPSNHYPVTFLLKVFLPPEYGPRIKSNSQETIYGLLFSVRLLYFKSCKCNVAKFEDL
jgi:hypothetical protein